MLTAIRGHYKDGKVELYETPHLKEGEIIITFIDAEKDGVADLKARGISPREAADLRKRLSTFEDDWGAEEMDIYDKA